MMSCLLLCLNFYMVNCLYYLQCIKRVSVNIFCPIVQCKQMTTGTSLSCLINYDDDDEYGIDDDYYYYHCY